MTEANIVVLIDEDNNEVEFEVIHSFSVEEKEYAVLVPVDGDDEEAVVFRVEEGENDEYIFEYIEDDEEFDAVAKAYDELLDELEKQDN